MDEQPVHHLDRLLGIVDRDVHVHAEDQLAPRDVLQLVDELAVAVAGRDPLALEEAERVRAGRRRSGSPRRARSRRRSRAAARARRRRPPAVRQTGVVTSSTDCISSAWMRSSCSPCRDRGEHRVDVLHEIPRLGVEQHVLLLDAERVRIALAERVVEHARVRSARALAPLPVIDGGKICFTR